MKGNSRPQPPAEATKPKKSNSSGSNTNNNNGSDSGTGNGNSNGVGQKANGGGAGAKNHSISPQPDSANVVEEDGQHNPGKMFIGGLSWNTSADGLREYFSKFGEVTECMVMRDPATKRARGFGFITFTDPASVEKVLAAAEHELDGKKIDPKVAFPKKTQPKLVVRTKKVFIGGLASSSTLDDMKTYFQQYGKIEDAMLMFDKHTQRHRGFGFITFDDDEVSEKVCEIHFHEINGKMVECKKAQPKEVMLPVQLSKSRAAAARNVYGLSPEQLLAYASYVPRLPPYGAANLLYPQLFNGYNQNFGMGHSGRSGVSSGGGASASGLVTTRDLAAAQAVAHHHQAAYEAAVAYMGGGGHAAAAAAADYFHCHQHQPGANNAYNKM